MLCPVKGNSRNVLRPVGMFSPCIRNFFSMFYFCTGFTGHGKTSYTYIKSDFRDSKLNKFYDAL